MGATVFFQGNAEIAQLQNTFKVLTTPTDPTTVSCVITDPNGTATTHTFGGAAPADITKTGTGVYQLNVPCTIVGLWAYVWIGTGAASDIQAGTWPVNPVNLQTFYTSVEEVKSRLGITDTGSDLEIEFAVASASRWVEQRCDRHFYQVTEARTFVPYSLYLQPLTDVVSISAFAVDYDGDGIFETPFVQNTDYELAIGIDEFNQLASGEARPYTLARITNVAGGGKFFPFIWPFSRQDRIQVTGTWGWPTVPYLVREAARQVAADFFKLKDSPFGMAGSPEFGLVNVQAATTAWELLAPYALNRRKVGV
jgi:hypothetical protein